MLIKKPRRQNNEGILAIFRNSRGQSMVEMLIVFSSMLFIILVTIQIALIFHAKITLNYAAFEAVRAGTLNNALFEPVLEGFARGLAPLYSYDENDLDQVGAFQEARDLVLSEYKKYPDKKLIRIERLNPSKQTFDAFGKEGVIPNDNLRFRSSMIDHRSGRTIQDANLLHLRITYWYPLYVPVVNKFIFGVVCRGKWQGDPVCSMEKPRIPLMATSVMRMQSDVKESNKYYRPL